MGANPSAQMWVRTSPLPAACGLSALIVSLRNASCEGETVIVDTPDASAFGSSRK